MTDTARENATVTGSWQAVIDGDACSIVWATHAGSRANRLSIIRRGWFPQE